MKPDPFAVNWSLSHFSRFRYSRRAARAASSRQKGVGVESSTTVRPLSSCRTGTGGQAKSVMLWLLAAEGPGALLGAQQAQGSANLLCRNNAAAAASMTAAGDTHGAHAAA